MGTGTMPQMTFELFRGGQNIQTANNDTDGIVTFDPITYDLEEDTADVFEISEVNDYQPGWAYDTSTFTVPIVKTIDADGYTTVVPASSPGFINTYTPNPVTVDISAVKNGVGKAPESGEFTVNVESNGQNFTAQNDAAGYFNIPIVYNTEGLYSVSITESSEVPSGWTANTNTYI
jgi:hypothetical protein